METFPNFIKPTGFYCSEKFDGIQARWDGQKLTTRTGNEINAPAWWLSRLPDRNLVGELWIGRNTFNELCSIVLRNDPDERWNWVQFKLFDELEQIEIKSPEHFETIFNDIVKNGGEGVVLTDRAGNQFKKKIESDDDGELIGFTTGAGRLAGMIGAFVLKLRNGKTFKLSAGLNDFIRSNPPKLGSIIKFGFNGLTLGGLPRFAKFYCVRAETDLSF